MPELKQKCIARGYLAHSQEKVITKHAGKNK